MRACGVDILIQPRRGSQAPFLEPTSKADFLRLVEQPDSHITHIQKAHRASQTPGSEGPP